MGSDAQGKQELPPALLPRAHLFCDLPEQSARIGEVQHAVSDAPFTPIGAMLSGATKGRRSDSTVFDSSAVSHQNLYVAKAILEGSGPLG